MLASASARDSEADGADADAGAARCDAGAAQKRRSSIIDEISAIGLGDDDDEDIPIKSPKDMNVRELKAALTEAGVRHDDAIEKFELIEVRRLEEVLVDSVNRHAWGVVICTGSPSSNYSIRAPPDKP